MPPVAGRELPPVRRRLGRHRCQGRLPALDANQSCPAVFRALAGGETGLLGGEPGLTTAHTPGFQEVPVRPARVSIVTALIMAIAALIAAPTAAATPSSNAGVVPATALIAGK